MTNNARAARTPRVPMTSARKTSLVAGIFYLVTFILGFGAMVLVGQDAIRAVDKGANPSTGPLGRLAGNQVATAHPAIKPPCPTASAW